MDTMHNVGMEQPVHIPSETRESILFQLVEMFLYVFALCGLVGMSMLTKLLLDEEVTDP